MAPPPPGAKPARALSARPARGARPARPRPATPPALAAYRAKRDFTRTPEPPAAARRAPPPPRGRSPGRYCVQKHLASHLHYDFRLEHGGVLLSWAIPKGPSTDPAVKRLAMQVEAHPLPYAAFEGVIPSGYGAGIVVLWDRGSWSPLEEDVDAALRAGHLALVLQGEKLQGRWDLIRIGGPQARTWLLVKQADAWAKRRDIMRALPASVTGSGDFADILAASRQDPWVGGAPAGSGPHAQLVRAIRAQAARLAQRQARAKVSAGR